MEPTQTPGLSSSDSLSLSGHAVTTTKEDPITSARAWRDTMRLLPGYEEGYSAAPGQAVRTFNVSSAVQLPYILAELHATGNSIRLDFPQRVPENTEVAKEQQAIREFLQQHHNSDLETLKAALTQLLEASPSYARLAAQSDFADKFPSAAQWIEANLARDTLHETAIAVTDILSADDLMTKSTQALLLSLEESAQAGRDTILTIPASTDAITSVREKLETLVSSHPELLDQPITVWTNGENQALREDPFEDTSIKEMTLAAFLNNAPVASSAPESTPENEVPPEDTLSKETPPSDQILTAGSDESTTTSLLLSPSAPHKDAPELKSEKAQPGLPTPDEILKSRMERLAEIRSMQGSLRHALRLANEVERLEQSVSLAKKRQEDALAKVRPLLQKLDETTTDSEKNENVHQGNETKRALQDKSPEGKAFTKAFHTARGLESKLKKAEEALHSACNGAPFESLLIHKGTSKPIITTATLQKALRTLANRAHKMQRKMAAVGTAKPQSSVTEKPTTSDTSRPSQSAQRMEQARLRRNIDDTRRKLKDASERLQRADKIEGQWAVEERELLQRGESLYEQKKALEQIRHLESLQANPMTRHHSHRAEINQIKERYEILSVRAFAKRLESQGKKLDWLQEDFVVRRDQKIRDLSTEVQQLQEHLATLEKRLVTKGHRNQPEVSQEPSQEIVPQRNIEEFRATLDSIRRAKHTNPREVAQEPSQDITPELTQHRHEHKMTL
jgi:hypothetical protein